LPDAEIVSFGAPCVSTAAMMLQKPPSNEKSPPLIEPAPIWPTVPSRAKSLLLHWPPPPETDDQSRLKSWAEHVKSAIAQVAVRKNVFVFMICDLSYKGVRNSSNVHVLHSGVLLIHSERD
jgi:hypothetical protein